MEEKEKNNERKKKFEMGGRIFLGSGKILNRERSFFAKTAVRKRYEKEYKGKTGEQKRGGEGRGSR